MERNGSSRRWFDVWRASLALLLVAAVTDSIAVDTNAAAQTSPSEPPQDPQPVPAPQPEEHAPGTPYQDGPGEIRFEELAPPSQEGVSAVDEWVQLQHGYEVHQAYSAHTRRMAQHADVQTAAYQSGTKGLDEVEIEP
jgi:hypothetical protein